MASEVVSLLVTDPAGPYVDCTIGGGGHVRAILAIAPLATIVGIDRDIDAITVCRALFPSSLLFHLPFSRIDQVRSALPRGAAGILFDLGLSSHQLTAERGFSFQADGPLDMRMSRDSGPSAAELLHGASEAELADLLFRYGEEFQSRRIARAIVQERAKRPIQTTGELAALVSRTVPASGVKSLARVFQSLRIAVNHELEEIAAALPMAFSLLRSGGRLAIISYHSLEDRIVKEFMRTQSSPMADDPRIPFPQKTEPIARLLTKKALVPGAAEIAANSRARSAKLRILERL